MSESPISEGRARRTDEAVERFENYETKLVQDPIFRQTIGASAPTSSLVAAPPKIGNWNVTIHERTRETQQKGPMKTLTRSLRPFPGGSLASTVRSENIGTGASAVGGGSKESKRKEVELKHTYGARRLSKAPQDKRLPVKTLSKASIGTLARMVRDPSSLDSPGDPALHLGGGPGDVALETEVGRGMTEVALSTTKLADILKMGGEDGGDSPDGGSMTVAQDSAPGFYPLQYFDDHTFELHSFAEWTRLALANKVQASSLWHQLDGSSEWQPCTVLEANENDESFLVRWTQNSKTKWVSRVNIYFAPLETAEHATRRRQQALNHRMRTEAKLRFSRKMSAGPASAVTALSPAQFRRIVSRLGLPQKHEKHDRSRAVAGLAEEVVQHYAETMTLCKHRRIFPLEDPEVNTLDPIEQVGLASLPISLLKIPGHGAFSVVPLVQGFSEDEQIDTNEDRKKQQSLAVTQVERGLSWQPPHLHSALTTMRGHVLALQSVSFLWSMDDTVTVEVFVEKHRKATDDSLHHLMTTVMDQMSDALLTAYAEEEDALLGAAETVTEPDRTKYAAVASLVNRMLADTLRSCIYADLARYGQVFADLTRDERPAHDPGHLYQQEYRNDPEVLPANLAHGKRNRRDALFDLRLDYITEPAPDLPSSTCTAAVAEAAAAGEGSEAGVGEDGETAGSEAGGSSAQPETGAVLGVARVFPTSDALLQAAEQAVHNLVAQLNSLPSFSVPAIDAVPAAPQLLYMPTDDPQVSACLATVATGVHDNACGPQAVLQALEQHERLVRVDANRHCRLFNESMHPPVEIEAEVESFQAPAAALLEVWPDSLTLRMNRIAIAGFKSEVRERSEGIKTHFDKIMARILSEPTNAEELADLQEYTKGIAGEVDELVLETDRVRTSLSLLEKLGHAVSDEALEVFWLAVGQPRELAKSQAFVVQRQEDERLHFMQDLRVKTSDFLVELKSIDAEMEKLFVYTDIELAEEYAGAVSVLEMRLKEAAETGRLINSREALFELEVSDFSDIANVVKNFEPYAQLWATMAQFNAAYPNWMHGTFDKLDSSGLSESITTWLKYAVKAGKTFSGRKEPESVLMVLRDRLEEMKQHLPLVAALRLPGMKDRHWDQVGEVVGQAIRPDTTTLKLMLDMNIEAFLPQIQAISDVAEKEYKFEYQLEKMRGEWRDLAFDLSPYKDTGTYVVKGVDEVVALLDDQIVKVQGMRGSPYAKGQLGTMVVEWNNRLVYMQEALDELLKVQKTWLYLEPIFASPDILRQMPTEGRRFQKVDAMYRNIMETASQASQVLQVMGIDSLKDNLVEANKLLDLVQKGLNDYLETKRSFFPRFYFLSNDELLDILSETKDPRRVEPHLSKCFEAINEVSFRGRNDEEQKEGGKMLDILAMVSGEGESVKLSVVVEPDADRNKGSVERWLVEMEESMRDTLKDVGRRAFEAYKETPRTQFVQEWTGMIVLAADCLYWTRDVETGMQEHGLEGVVAVEKKMVAELGDIVALVRGDISRQTRLILGAMVVLDVHNKDVVSLLIANKISSPYAFDWNSQLRYYLHTPDFDAPWHKKGEEVVTTRMMNAQLAYGYEYLGNSMRLVVTPLTDRCYRTLFGALHLSLGGAPEGPAGTGKTETVKDLAKAIAKQCIVFNCSDGLDYLAMAKFFKGLSSCGAWACFDEFNRIDLEVLSVIAQQILTLNDAIRQGIQEISFEGSNIQCVKGYSSFITMNPGYAGRSELPDNLKALFRPCAMMVPDYAMISEICLYSYGFNEARDLARKLVKSLQISSEQLSSQVHYDFGMRAVKSILTAAGKLKLEYLQEQEDILVLRAINDVNLPKFVDADLPLFQGITSDLFLGLKVPTPDYEILLDGMKAACGQLMAKCKDTHTFTNIQPTSILMTKCIQFYETVTVRHSLMIVGAAMSMKTTVFRTLQHGMNNVKDKSKFEDVLTFALNPKSITIDQIYGNFDLVSREWVEGIGATLVRKAAQMDSDPELKPKRKWIMFDGPVDAIWIENMNTVMDDNKKLCLTSGEIIKLTNTMTMVFEPEDLNAASPATVSRNGMVLMEPHMFRWQELRDSWLDTLPPPLADDKVKAQMNVLLDYFLPPVLRLLRRECHEPVVTKDTEIVMSLLRLLNCMLADFKDEEKAAKISAADTTKKIDGGFLFALIWSTGATTDGKGRTLYNDALRDLMAGNEDKPAPKITVKMPEKGSVYDWCWDHEKNKWLGWLETIPTYNIPPGTAFGDILVPTVDTVRYTHLMTTLMGLQYHSLFVGDTGTGKSVMIKDRLMKLPDKYMPHFMNFSAQTKANQTQDIIDNKIDKRRKGVYGPPLGKKMIVFVDDLNMPAKEKYGAQPPIEILRQLMHWGGWWDRKEIEWRTLIDLIFVAGMGLPGGGRTHLTCRYTRWFNVVCVTPIDNEGMARIFVTILQWFMGQFTGISAAAVVQPIVQATLDVFATVSRELLPTPSKSHYTFNLRDLAKVVQGVMNTSPTECGSDVDMFRLWIHEARRVFQDRLIDEHDREWFLTMQGEVVQKHFKKTMNKIVGDGANGSGLLLYADFLNKNLDYESRKYCQVHELPGTFKVVQDYLDEYNSVSKTPMNLVLFNYVLEHCCRMTRILRQPAGHALLVGVGGSGRQSVARLAAAIGEFELFQIQISKNYNRDAWFEDLRQLFRKAGEKNERVAFLFTDTQVVMESMLEDINNILNTGSVPNLFPAEEVMQLVDAVGPRARAAGKGATMTECFEFFIDTCRANMHCVLCMSPIGDDLRNRLRSFPSLVNCCTIDWFFPWPEDGLIAVADQFLSDLGLEDQMARAVVEQCMSFQVSARMLSERFQSEVGRINYVTPTSYLELIGTLKALLNKKKDEVTMQRNRYVVGLDKIASCSAAVDVMKEELIALQPVLVVKTKEVEDLIVVLDKEKADAAVVKESTAKEEAIASEEAEKVGAEKASCEADLAEAIPALNAAISALNSLTKGDITEMKGMKNPPKLVKLVMEGVCIMLEVKPEKVPAEDGKGKVDSYWGPSTKIMADTAFLQRLKDYDKDHIPEAVMKKIKTYTAMEEFQPAVIEKVSKAATGLCKWVRAMEIYDRVAKVVEPKRIALKEAEENLAVMMAALREKQAALKEINDKIAKLEQGFEDANNEKVSLANQVDTCEKKLDRAGKLISGLGGEKDRWTHMAHDLAEKLVNVTGDVLISSAIVAYLGVFSADYRDDALTEWIQSIKEKDIPGSPTVTLEAVLGDPVQIREWNLSGLPRDALSTDNAIIMSKSRRWPLMIDPQGQANKWIRKMEEQHSLDIVKLTHANFVRTITGAVTYGRPVLLENVGETIDSILEPLISKSTYKSGSSVMLKLGDEAVEYHEDFRLYITTKLPSPHYTPEISTKVVVINFTITPAGLTDQLLGITVETELPDLEKQRQQLVVDNAGFKKQIAAIENKILQMLSEAGGDILEDEELINTLSASKTTSKEITRKLGEAEKTEAKINESRIGYMPYAERGSLLFFCVAELRTIEPMYQYSLGWFVNLFVLSMTQTSELSPEDGEIEERVKVLSNHFTEALYKNVCRSLFAKDKILYSFLVCTRLMLSEDRIRLPEMRFLLSGIAGPETKNPPPKPATWMPERVWVEVLQASQLPTFADLPDNMIQNIESWRQVYDAIDPASQTFPGAASSYSEFDKIAVLRCLRPDKVVPQVQKLVMNDMGPQYMDPPNFNLQDCYDDSTPVTPLIFVLSPGADPNQALIAYSDSLGVGREMLSLGQGQGPIAERMIEDAIDKGSWVILQNCHLSPSWMPKLEAIVEKFDLERCSAQFRLWLTSYPSDRFPVAILQNGIKMTLQPPKGLRANMLATYAMIDEDFFTNSNKPSQLRKLHFALAHFHASLQERIKYGALGFNIPYSFTESDYLICQTQVKMFLDEFDEIPWEALRYTAGETNYGGRVTDAHDRTCVNAMLKLLYNPGVLRDDYKFSESGTYFAPPEGSIDDHRTFLRNLPQVEAPECFGLHENANITFATTETYALFGSMLSLLPKGGGGGDGLSKDSIIQGLAENMLERLPVKDDFYSFGLPWLVHDVAEIYPTDYKESMNTVLTQELLRYNGVITNVRATLQQLVKAVQGIVVMSTDLELMATSFVNGSVPALWSARCYPSLKPLGAFYDDFIRRLAFLQTWINDGAPAVFWLPGFYFTQSFLTGTLQNFARKYTMAIDTLGWSFEVKREHRDMLTERAADGCYVDGLFFDGAGWDTQNNVLAEQDPKVLFVPVPVIHFKPSESKNIVLSDTDYRCPVYKTSERKGTLSTTGHSTNFVLDIIIPSPVHADHWILRGVACLTSLDF